MQNPNTQVYQQKQQKQDFTNYGDPLYWQKRYEKTRGQRFDWLQTFQTCFNVIQQSLKFNKNAKILNIGCGNGCIQDELYQSGYQNIVNNDISKICIEDMQKIRIQKNYQKMIYQVMDVQSMTYKDEQFDMVLDKSTIDALMCSDQPIISVCKMVEQVYRVLKPNGVYLIISYASPGSRLENLKREHVKFDIKIDELRRQTNDGILLHYVYICKKLPMNKMSQYQKQQFYQKMNQLQDYQYPPINN